MPSDVALLETVSRLALFADLGQGELDELLPSMKEVMYSQGQWVLRRGQERPGLHIIVDGEVGILLFGEISALLDEPVVADVIARAPLRCLHIPADEVEGFLTANPRVTYRMLQTEARRLRDTDERRI